MVADLTRMGEWSPENAGATWRRGHRGRPRVPGSGRPTAGKGWGTTGTIVEAEPGRVLSFRVTAVGIEGGPVDLPVRADRRGLPVTESWDDERNALVKALGKPVSGVADRAPTTGPAWRRRWRT